MKRRAIKHHSIRNQLLAAGLTRRQVLGFLGGSTAVSLAGCFRAGSSVGQLLTVDPMVTPTAAPATQTAAPAVPACIIRPQQTAGPYFVDERLNRSDIRTDPTDGSIRPGALLRLVFQVSQVSASACRPLPNASIDIWHCDAVGRYSDVADRDFSTVGKKFLRGYQVTDTDGVAEFTTIYPGWYPGRTVHIHFKIRTASLSQPAYEFTSQLYFEDALTNQIHTQSPYTVRGQSAETNDQDGIFRNGGAQLILPVTATAEGYLGRFGLGLELA